MNRQERLEQLRKLRIERQEEYDEPVFESHSACLKWIDKVAPLLRYDQQHYNSFQYNAQFMHEDLSATRLMTHLNGMISTVNQAIAELEMPEQAPSKKEPREKRSWLRCRDWLDSFGDRFGTQIFRDRGIIVQ
jgi:flagellar biosynthesis chaperone FliJ